MADEIVKKYGGLKIIWHPDKLKSFKDGVIKAPLYVRIKPTNKCDHNCFYCSYAPEFKYIYCERFKREDEIPREIMLDILEDFKEIGVKAITFSGGGEPLVYPYIIETMKKVLENGIDLSIITNGQSLSGEKAELLKHAKWVRISLDSINAETFVATRKRPEQMFHKLIENIREFAKIKNPSCEFGINFVVNEKNTHQVYDAVKFFKELGVNHIKITPVYIPDGKFQEYHRDTRESVQDQIKRAKEDFAGDGFGIYDTYENDFKLTGINQRTYHRCFIMQTVPIIGADSCVYFCHDKAYTHKGMLGCLKDKRFKDLWFSKEAEEKFKTFDAMKECCHHCTYDQRNILIGDTIASWGEHVNFV